MRDLEADERLAALAMKVITGPGEDEQDDYSDDWDDDDDFDDFDDD